MDSKLFDKVYGCLCGGLIGDAMGAPAEGLHYREVEEQFGWINAFQGAGTDDSAIKQILCQAILENDGYVTADEWAEAFLKNKKRYYPLFFIPVKNMFHKLESGLVLPVYAGMGNMHSSSSAMSIAPIGLINACDPRQAALETYDVAGLLHGEEATFCRDGASAMAAAIAEAMRPAATVEGVLEAALKYLHPISSADFLAAAGKSLELSKAVWEYEAFREIFYEECLGDIVSDSRETVPCVLSLFHIARGDAEKAITYAANFGRDADTIGTMVGALCGAFGGVAAFPSEWIARLEEGYGQTQPASKDEYDISGVEIVDQRGLARDLTRVILRRKQARLHTLEELAALEG